MKYCCLQSIVIPGKPIIRGLEIEMAVEGRLQNYLEKFLPYSLIASALIAGVYGYYTWSFKKTVVTYGMGVFLALVVVVPDWAFFKRHPSEWCIPVASDPQSAAAQKVRFEILNKTPEYAERYEVSSCSSVIFEGSGGYRRTHANMEGGIKDRTTS
eukprot:Gb_13119 [translate_table: standard]